MSALWLLADLTLLTLLTWACRRGLDVVWPVLGGTRGVAVAVGAILVGACTIFRDAAAAQYFEQSTALLGNLVLGLLVPAVLFAVVKVRKE